MGFFRWLRGGTAGTDLIRIEIMMDYSGPIWGNEDKGTAAIRWSMLASDLPEELLSPFRAALIALLYAEALVIQDVTRGQLGSCVNNAVHRFIQSSDDTARLDFDEWNVKAGGKLFPIWPWVIVDTDAFNQRILSTKPALGCPRTYTATLKAGPRTSSAPEGLWAFIEMPLGQELACVPSAPLIAAYSFGATNNRVIVSGLCVLLHNVNRYYQGLGRFPLGSYARAVAHGMAAVRKMDSER
jgi:hypothetical protein